MFTAATVTERVKKYRLSLPHATEKVKVKCPSSQARVGGERNQYGVGRKEDGEVRVSFLLQGGFLVSGRRGQGEQLLAAKEKAGCWGRR